MSVSFRCGECKKVCVAEADMIGKQVRCTCGRLLTVPPGPAPVKRSATTSGLPVPPLPSAGASKTRKLAPSRKPVEPSEPAPKKSPVVAVVVLCLVPLLLAGLGLAAWALFPGDSAKPTALWEVTGSGEYRVGAVFTVRAVIPKPTAGLTVSIELPEGVELVGTPAKQEVPDAGGAESAVAWSVRGASAGTRTFTLRASNGTDRQLSVVVTPGEARSNVELVVPPKMTSEVGAVFTVRAVVRNPTSGLTVSVELPEGLELAGDPARQPVPSGNESTVAWSIKGASPGTRTLTFRTSDGVERRMVVDTLTKGANPVQLGRTMDRLDRTQFDVQLPPSLANEPTPAVWDGHTNDIRSVAYTNDGQFVVSVSGDISRDIIRPADNSIRVWDAKRGKQVHKVEGFAEALASLSISPGGRFALCSFGGYWKDDKFIRTKDHGIFMWDIQAKKAIGPDVDLTANPTGGRLEKPKPRFLGLKDMAFATDTARDNDTVVAGDGHGAVVFWNTKTGEVRSEIEVAPTRGSVRGVYSAKFSPDGEHVVVLSADYTLRVHSTKTGQAVSRPLMSHLDIVWCLALRQPKEGTFLALSGGGSRQKADNSGFEPGARDYVIRLWDLNKGVVLRRFAGHEDDIASVAFCPDNRHFVSVSRDKTVRLWDLDSGKQVRLLGKHDSPANSVSVSPDGRSCVSGGSDCKVRFWQIPTGQDIVEALAKKDLPALRKAADDMTVIGPDAVVAFDGLLKCLGPDEGAFRKPAAKILTQLVRSSGPAGLPFERSHIGVLRKALEGAGPPEVFVTAALGLGVIGPDAEDAVPALLKHFQGKDADAATVAGEAIYKIGVKSDEVVAAFQKGLAHEEIAIRKQSLMALQRLAPEKITVALLLDRLENDGSTEIQMWAEKTFRDRFPTLTRRDVPALREGLKARPARVCLCCADAVTSLRAQAVDAIPELTALLKRPESPVVRAALRASKAFGMEGRPAAPEVVKFLKDDEARKTHPAAITEAIITLRAIDPGNEAIETVGIPLLLKNLKPQTTEEMKAVLANPLGREEVSVLATLGKPLIRPLLDELKIWVPTNTKNADHGATLARFQIYKLLEDLADKSTTDEEVIPALKARQVYLKTFIPKETFLAQKAIKELPFGEREPYVRTAVAAKEAYDKIFALRSSKP